VTQSEGIRLQKVLAEAGYGSRRICEQLIDSGRVTVNGEVAVLGRRVDPENDLLALDGAPVATRSELVHYLLNKPVGVVSTASDPEGRPMVVDLVPESPRVYPVGRLDYGTEGLLILTNNGELTNRLTHPRFGVEKEYLAHVEGIPSNSAISKLRNGVELEDGMTAPAKVGTPAPGVVRIVIHEGRNRQVRRMLEAVGHPVVRLVRSRIGPIRDPDLAPGTWRHLTPSEVRGLAEAASAPSVDRGAPRRK